MMGTRHWPEDADEAVEKLEQRIDELEAQVKQAHRAGQKAMRERVASMARNDELLWYARLVSELEIE